MSRYEVRQLNPAKQRLLLAVVSVAVFALVVASFWFGHHRAGKDFESLEERVGILNQQLTSSQDTQQQLRNEKAVLQRSNELDNAAMQVAKEELASVQADMVELKEELTFYQSLLSPQERAPGLHVQSIQLQKLDEGLYGYTLILTQVHQNGRFAKGQVSLGLPTVAESQIGEPEETEVVLTEVLDQQNFNFKFFQRIEGQLQLAEGLVPGQLAVKVAPAGRRLKNFDQLYDWAVLIGGSL